jgi:hypothetical protein
MVANRQCDLTVIDIMDNEIRKRSAIVVGVGAERGVRGSAFQAD